MSISEQYTWLIAYIDADQVKHCQRQLSKFKEYKEIEPYIPTVRVLKKKFKNENFFEDVPLLFQYGFFKVPTKHAIHYMFLENMQKNISCIYGWVKDPANTIMGNHSIPVATATAQEIACLIRSSVNLGAHSKDDLNLLSAGDFVILKGYPYEGIQAEIVTINHKKKKVKVRMVMFSHSREVEVSFDNVFFNLYSNKGYDDSVSLQKSLDEMADNNTIDKLFKKAWKDDK